MGVWVRLLTLRRAMASPMASGSSGDSGAARVVPQSSAAASNTRSATGVPAGMRSSTRSRSAFLAMSIRRAPPTRRRMLPDVSRTIAMGVVAPMLVRGPITAMVPGVGGTGSTNEASHDSSYEAGLRSHVARRSNARPISPVVRA